MKVEEEGVHAWRGGEEGVHVCVEGRGGRGEGIF